MAFDFLDWSNKRKNENTVYFYKGAITSDVITNILTEIESKLNDIEENNRIKRMLYNILVESLQNLYHHTEVYSIDLNKMYGSDRVWENNLKFGVIFLEKINNFYKITTGNYVRKSKIQIIKDKLDQINALSPDEVKSLYKLILNNLEFSDRGGGGLGLIDIAKRSESKFIYSFYEFTPEISFYCIEVNLRN